MDYFKSFVKASEEDEAIVPMASEGIGVNFGFFLSDDASKINSGNTPGGGEDKKKSSKKSVTVSGKEVVERAAAGGVVNNNPAVNVETVDYAQTYTETNALIKGAIAQADELSMDIKRDIDEIRASKTLKGKYTYITNLTSSASSLLSTKISAIKELNSTITQGHNLELNRMKALKLDAQKEGNDDMRIMDMYSAFINTPVGSYTPAVPSIQDITLGVNSQAGGVTPVEMSAPNGVGGAPLTPEQNRMLMESNPNIQVVVRYNQTTGQRAFDVVDRTTGVSVPNYPCPDVFLLEDTTIDVHAGIARNRNVNAVWPLMVEGSNAFVTEY